MMGLLVLKEHLRIFYAKYGMAVNPLVKLGVSYLAFHLLNQNLGFMEALKKPVVPAVGAAACSMLPYGLIAVLAAGFMVAHISVISFELALIAFVFMLIIALLYYGFNPGDGYLLLLTPMMFFFKIPYVIPLLVGLGGSMTSVLPVSCGAFIYYIILYIRQNASVLTGGSLDITQKYAQVIRAIMSNQWMIVMILASAAGILIVHVVHSLSVDYSWLLAIVAGAIAQMAVIFVGSFSLEISVPMEEMVIGLLISSLIAGIYVFFVFAVDYSRTEYLQYDDDEYYYYVKAVPKIVISTPDVKVKKINARRSSRGSR